MSFTGSAFEKKKKEIKQDENALKSRFYIITSKSWVVKFITLHAVTAQFTSPSKEEIQNQARGIPFKWSNPF